MAGTRRHRPDSGYSGIGGYCRVWAADGSDSPAAARRERRTPLWSGVLSIRNPSGFMAIWRPKRRIGDFGSVPGPKRMELDAYQSQTVGAIEPTTADKKPSRMRAQDITAENKAA